jgi:hypothetical protein
MDDSGNEYDKLDDELDLSNFSFADCIDPSDEHEDFSQEELEEDEEEPGNPVCILNTWKMKQKLEGQDTVQKVVNIIDFMATQGMNLPLFLDILSWGDSNCI